MQMIQMVAPAMNQASGMAVGKASSGNSGTGSPFQSALTSASNGKSSGDLTNVLEGMSKEELTAFVKGQMVDGMSLADLLASLADLDVDMTELFAEMDAEELLSLLDVFPNLNDIYSEIDALKEAIEAGDEAEREAALAEMKAILKELLQAIGEIPIALENNAPALNITMAEDLSAEDVKANMQSLLNDIAQLLETYRTEGKLNGADASKLTALMKQWALLLQQAKELDFDAKKLQVELLDDEDSELLDKLMERLSKRSYLANKNMYAQNAHVSKNDVMRWLQQAVDNQGQNTPQSVSGNSEQQMPMSKVEQYVIHLEQTGRVEKVSADLVNKFANIVKESNFLKSDGKMELNMMLKPANLGNIQVKMTQIDGEIMVRLLVSSQAAKEMLENNIHQLRHLFAPHQVSIERAEAVSDDEFYFDEQEDEDAQERSADDEATDQQEQNDGNVEMDFESIFQQLSEEVEN